MRTDREVGNAGWRLAPFRSDLSPVARWISEACYVVFILSLVVIFRSLNLLGPWVASVLGIFAVVVFRLLLRWLSKSWGSGSDSSNGSDA